MKPLFLFCLLLSASASFAWDDPLLDVKPNAYGLGVGSDQYGRPVQYKTSDDTYSAPDAESSRQYGTSRHEDPSIEVKPHAYGLGTGMDQYGRPVKVVPRY